jgi:hypothetical protein
VPILVIVFLLDSSSFLTVQRRNEQQELDSWGRKKGDRKGGRRRIRGEAGRKIRRDAGRKIRGKQERCGEAERKIRAETIGYGKKQREI